MKKLKIGDRIKLYGGYDMDPPWVKDGDGYYARIVSFFDNEIEGREDDSRISAAIEFDEELEIKNFKSRFGFILCRWEGQEWDTEGVVHVHLSNKPVTAASDISGKTSIWVESHASYKKVSS
jgi:hypothetical protein